MLLESYLMLGIGGIVGVVCGWLLRGFRVPVQLPPLVKLPPPVDLNEQNAVIFAVANPAYALAIIDRYPQLALSILKQIDDRSRFQILNAQPQFIAPILNYCISCEGAPAMLTLRYGFCVRLAALHWYILQLPSHRRLFLEWIKKELSHSGDEQECGLRILLRFEPSLAGEAAALFPDFVQTILKKNRAAFSVSAIDVDQLPVVADGSLTTQDTLPRSVNPQPIQRH